MKKALLFVLLSLICCCISFANANTVTIPDSTVCIEDETFMNDASVTDVVLPETLEQIGARAFAYSGLTTIKIPESVTSIGDNAFLGCDSLVAGVYYHSYAHEYCVDNNIQFTILNPQLIKVGIINMDPAVSGYWYANVKDMNDIFTEENGYDATFCTVSPHNKQVEAAYALMGFGIKYLIICPSQPTGWDGVLQEVKNAGVEVFLYERMIDCDPSLYKAAIVSGMENEGELAVSWLENLNLSDYNILHLMGPSGSNEQVGRAAALHKKVQENEHWTIVHEESFSGSLNAEEVSYHLFEVLNGSSINVIVAQNNTLAQLAEDALDMAGIVHNGQYQYGVYLVSYGSDSWALSKLLDSLWHAVVECNPRKAVYIDQMIKTLEEGKQITGLNNLNQFIIPEVVFDYRTITSEDIAQHGHN